MIIYRKKFFGLLDIAINPVGYTVKKQEEKGKIDTSKMFSSREKVPSDIAKEGKKSGVVQKDKNGNWRIISYKTNPPEFWNAHYNSKEDAEKALSAYHANK